MPRQVAGRGDRDLAQGGADARRDHVAVEQLAQSYARVESFGDDVDRCIIDGDLQHDIGMLGEERRQRGRKDGLIAEPLRVDAEPPGYPPPGL